MRLVVLLCGVIAGIVGLGFAWWGEPAALVDIYRLPTPTFAVAVLAIHIVSANSIAGGLLVLGNPRLGGVMMLASATIWLLLVALLGGGLGVSLAALIGIGGVGGMLAFLPSLGRAAYRLEPAREDAPRIIVTSQPDLVEQVRPRVGEPAEEQPASYNWRSAVSEPTEDHSKPFEPTQWRFTEPQDKSDDTPYGPRQWRFEHPDVPPAEPAASPPPLPREPPRPEPPEREQLREALRRPAAANDPQPWIGREDREDRPAYEIHHGRIRPLTLKTPRRKRFRGRTAMGLVALGLLVIGLPTLLVVDHQMRTGHDAASSPLTASGNVAVATAAEAAGESAEASEMAPVEPRLDPGNLPAFDEQSPPADAAAPPVADVAAVAPAEAAPVETAVAPDAKPPFPMPLPAPRPVLAAYKTPFDYCAQHRDMDTPDLSAIGEGLPPELIDGVREVTKLPGADVLWRCMTKSVWVCAQAPGGVACGKVPTPAERKAYCVAHPGATDIVAAAGTWRCDGSVPFVPGGDQRTTDPRGFDRLAWLRLGDPPKGSAG